MSRRTPCTMRLIVGGALSLLTASPIAAQWSTAYEQFYLQAPHNWQFRTNYASADRLFNAFDFGHAILYETLWRFPNAPASALEEQRYDQLTRKILVNPPRLPLEEAAIEPMYARLAPEAKVMFDWAHLLHRQLYDVLADERLAWPAKDAEIARLVRYYRSRPDLAFSSQPKTMRLMQEQPYSLAFRKRYPKFNGLIWGYHWLQMGLYEPLLVGTSVSAKQAGVRATVARFFQMLSDAPNTLPYQMPMTVAVAPAFAARYPEAAIIFDNLHSMHDVVSDILTNPMVPRERKRAAILKAARAYRDDTTEVMSVEAWRTMSIQMGVENMGGPSVGFVPALPTPTVTAGAVMQHDVRTGAMTGFSYGAAIGDAHAGMNHADTTHAVMDHAAMGHAAAPAADTARPTPAPVAARPRWSDADVTFVQAVRVQSQATLDLTVLARARGRVGEVRRVAERIASAERRQLDQLETWLTSRSLPFDDAPSRPAAAALVIKATGTAFDRQLLQALLDQHTAMLATVAARRATAGDQQDPSIAELVGSIVSVHELEIGRLRAMMSAP